MRGDGGIKVEAEAEAEVHGTEDDCTAVVFSCFPLLFVETRSY